MRKTLLLLSLIFSLATCICQAQNPMLNKRLEEKREEILAAKKEVITDRINLSPEQEKDFWPIYDQYTQDKLVLKRQMQQLRQKSMNMTVTEDQLSKLVDEMFALKQKDLDLDKKAKTDLLKVINIRQLAELYRTETEFLRRILQILREKFDD